MKKRLIVPNKALPNLRREDKPLGELHESTLVQMRDNDPPSSMENMYLEEKEKYTEFLNRMAMCLHGHTPK